MAAAIKAEIEGLSAKIADKKAGKEALEGLGNLVGDRANEPFLIAAMPKILVAASDKSKVVATAAIETATKIMTSMSPFALDMLLPTLHAGLSVKAKPAEKEATLKLITAAAAKSPKTVGYLLVVLISPVADLTCDIKKEVRAAAVDTMTAICNCTGNRDLEPFLPSIVLAAQSLDHTHKCVETLAGCIFVQNVETPALAATLPVLVRGLNDKSEEVQRTCCLIVDNMCKLVEDPAEVHPIMPKLEPRVKAACEKMSDPEARGMAEKAYKTMMKTAEGVESKKIELEDTIKLIKEICGDKVGSDACTEVKLNYFAALASMATNMKDFSDESWKKEVGFFAPFDSFLTEVKAKMEVATAVVEEVEEEDEEGVDLYKGSFSLAYGTLTLLRDTKLRLKRLKFYGLLGPNQCGKTTLMRAIGNEQLEGFPTRAELLSIFVEHEIPEEEIGVQDDGFPILSVDKPGWWWVQHTVNDIYHVKPQVSEETCRAAMKETGFGYVGGPDVAAHMDGEVTSYSGGWKMKMQLTAAKLINADVLMLDEPTGHLDVNNIKWLEDWLEAFTGSIICTSHFSPFLDKMCTHIIDFQDRKLKTFKSPKGSCLSKFVEKYPEKKAYFELCNDVMQFTFPDPGPLEGVKSRTKVILRMQHVYFQYPSKDKPTVMDINLTCSQVSRVAVIGANGAGKSTAIKVLVGEAIPQQGSIWKAPGMRLAYVAQHAFHHLEQHMVETPVQYIMWRFAGNDDRESLEFKTDELSEDEETLRKVKWCVDGVTGNVRRCILKEEDPKKAKQDEGNAVTPNAVLGRKNLKKEKTMLYEVNWMYKPNEANTWVEKATLTTMGYVKMVQREDERQAAMAGLQTKQLTQPGVEKHLFNFGVDPESASHTQINQLSGGVKVKVVLAAAMWQNPHILILDEPTNYLDREGLGALVLAIQDFKGGVLIISHNKEFCDGVATEKWIMNKGYLRIEGESVGDDEADKAAANKEQEDVYDSFGNKIDVKGNKEVDDKVKKKQLKELEKKLKDDKKKMLLSQEEKWELEDKIAALKESLDDKAAAKAADKAAAKA